MSRLAVFSAMLGFACVAGIISLCALQANARDTRNYAPMRTVTKPVSVNISNLAPPGDVVVKFREGSQIAAGKARLGGPDAQRVLDAFTRRNLMQLSPSISGDVTAIRSRREAAEDRVKTLLPDLSLYVHHPINNPSLAEQLINELNGYDEVEIAYFAPRPEPAAIDAPAGTRYAGPMGAMTTPNFESGQLYLNSAPGGVDARAAWTLPGGTGAGTQVIDIEYGWQLTHEDLSAGATAIIIGGNDLGDTDHGTAVLGEMVADRNGFGMTGIAYDADIGVSTAMQGVAEAITQAAAASNPGDAVLIELHSPGPRFNYEFRDDQRGYIAMEWWQENFDAILNAWGQGVIICEAAGNGEENFDDAIYLGYFDTAVRNSHAIMCGAGNPPNSLDPDRSRLSFSNYGQRVNLQGYGIMVYTTGYGDLYNTGGQNYWYTAGFSGTSSASPIVTGSVLATSGVFQQMLGFVPDADTIRNLLIATGSPQQFVGVKPIGPRPNLQAALATLFDPIDSIAYGDVALEAGQNAAVPVTFSNSHPVRDIYVPFRMTGPAEIFLDSMTRGPRTTYFEQVSVAYDERWNGKLGFRLRADNGGGALYLQAGSGVIGYLWVHSGAVSPGQVNTLDSAWLGSSTRLRLVSAFDDGYPDYFDAGSITISAGACDCSFHGDINGDGSIDITDVVATIAIAFRGDPPATTDPACPHQSRADYTCDGTVDIVDVIRAIDYAFRGGAPVCDPCNL